MSKVALIVEDHPIVTESVLRLISDSGVPVVCLCASTGVKGLGFLNGQHVDIVLLDISLPDMSGIDFCKEARQRFPDLKILAITSMAQRHVVENMLENGANGFVLKTSDSGAIIEGMKAVLDGKSYLGVGVKDLLERKYNPSDDVPVLSKREIEVLRLIADGLTNQEIGEKLFISPLTVDSHRKNLLLKFGAKNTASLIKIAMMNQLI